MNSFRKSNVEKWGVKLAAILTFLMGMVNLVSAIQPALLERLALIGKIIPLEVRYGGRLTSTLAGFALFLLASSLWRRKRVAWFVTAGLLLVSALSHLIKGLDFEEASLSLILFFFLLALRNSFHAESDRPSVKQGLLTLVATLVFTLLYGTIGFYFLDRHFSTPFNLIEAIRQTVVMFTAFYDPGLQPITGFGRYFADSIYIIGIVTLAFAFLMLIRPVLVRQAATQEERARAAKIVQRFGRTSLARAALFEDKSYFFASEETVIAYAVSGRGAIALGDPIGPLQQIAQAIMGFRDFCTHNDWTPAFVSTLPDYLDEYQTAGFETVCIGFEAIVLLENFSLEGSKNKELRNAVSRMERLGYSTEVHLPPLNEDLIHSLREISDAWLTMRHGGEMHFSDGWFEEDYIRSTPVIVVRASDGNLTAFANLVSEYQNNELTLDLMRHLPKIQNGTMEFLFVRMLQWAKEKGYDTFSLGLSAIVGVGEKAEDPRVEQALHILAGYVSRFYNFKGLHTFKEKFHPQWQPRYLVYPGAASLPLVLSTLLKVHSGKNYLVRFLWK
jgi:phosphatidylglycerol lysyltransferase